MLYSEDRKIGGGSSSSNYALNRLLCGWFRGGRREGMGEGRGRQSRLMRGGGEGMGTGGGKEEMGAGGGEERVGVGVGSGKRGGVGEEREREKVDDGRLSSGSERGRWE
ncbi:hypothetical protein Ancab_005091 [Ancistrocladus abbreviatus]